MAVRETPVLTSHERQVRAGYLIASHRPDGPAVRWLAGFLPLPRSRRCASCGEPWTCRPVAWAWGVREDDEDWGTP